MKKINKKIKNKQNVLKFDAEILFYFFIMGILPLFIAAFYLQFDKINNPKNNAYLAENLERVMVKTDKNIYEFGDKIILAIENYSDRSIYSEPCEYLDNFEKYINGKWINLGVKHDKIKYDKSEFNLSKKITKCTLSLPKEEGVYRFIVKVYQGCQKPEICKGAIDFRSNEFRVEKSVLNKVSSN